jgi:hypothetical protein
MSFRGLVAVGALVACGPGLKGAKAPDVRDRAKAVMADASGDADAIEELFHESVALGHLHFDDPSCATAFPPGVVRSNKFEELARCLAGLKLRTSDRVDGLGDVVVLSYGPGFEVEARVIVGGNRALLTWIGFASQHAGSLAAPTLDTAAFESLRLSGTRVPALDDATAKRLDESLSPDIANDVVMVWLKICLDETGAVSRVDPYQPGSYVALEVFSAIAKTWTFRPFVHAETPRAVCSMVRMAHPAKNAPSVEELPLPPPPSMRDRPPLAVTQAKFAKSMKGRRISGAPYIAPDDDTKTAIMRAPRWVQPIIGSFRVCLDETGRVESVLPMKSTGFPAYDQKLLTGIGLWRYSPYMVDDQPVPVCTAVTFVYSQGHR